jgi:tRNA (guanine37-N1)-methyltransferase
MIHCYCFSKADDPAQDAIDRANAVMGTQLPRDAVQVHFVRDVAPKKPMMCLSFRAPAAAAAAAAVVVSASSDAVAAAAVAAEGEQPAAKRQKTDSATASTTASTTGE